MASNPSFISAGRPICREHIKWPPGRPFHQRRIIMIVAKPPVTAGVLSAVAVAAVGAVLATPVAAAGESPHATTVTAGEQASVETETLAVEVVQHVIPASIAPILCNA
jgi:hypothetical protein